jgi:prepilin-type processing-associated H-X9-DG protein
LGGGVAANAVVESRIIGDIFGAVSTSPPGGYAGGGMLPVNESLTMAANTDGTANTIIVGEHADWYYAGTGTAARTRATPHNAPSVGVGWLAGTNRAVQGTSGAPVPGNPAVNFSSTTPSGGLAGGNTANLITVYWPVGTNNRQPIAQTPSDYGTGSSGGIGHRGPMLPLLSAHPAGAQAGFMDGHVQMLTKQTPTYILKRLAIRDDGGVIGDF